jgi:hypothetical protein
MMGFGGMVLETGGIKKLLKGEYGSKKSVDSQKDFASKFAADSREAGLARSLVEHRKRAERLVAEENWQDALQSFENMAHDASELKDKSSEAVAVLGMAECLSKPSEIDVELICGLYRHAGEAAGEAGEVNVRFLALVGCACIRRSCRMFERSVALWEVALDLAAETGDQEHAALAQTQLAMTLLNDPSEANLDIVDETKGSVGHATVSERTSEVNIQSGQSSRMARAFKLLEQVVQELPESASPMQRVRARMNFAAALKAKKGTQSMRRAEREMVSALDILTASGGDQNVLRSVEISLLDHYEENPCLLDGDQEAMLRFEKLRAKREAAPGKLEQIITEGGKPLDPDERYAHEKAAWARQKLEAMKRRNERADESDSDVEGATPARPAGDGWQK